MKDKWWVTRTKPLADFMPTILLKAKDFATEITIFEQEKSITQLIKTSGLQNTNTEKYQYSLKLFIT